MLLYKSMGKYSVTNDQRSPGSGGVLCVKSDRISLASGSAISSSNVVSLTVMGDVGITGRDMDAAEALTKGWRLVSGAIVWCLQQVPPSIFNVRGLGIRVVMPHSARYVSQNRFH